MDSKPVLPVDPYLRAWFIKKDMKELQHLYDECVKAEAGILENLRAPELSLDTGRVLNISDRYLSKATKAKIKACAGALKAVELPIDDNDGNTGWLLPVPASAGQLPDDLGNCFRFACRMDAQFVFFRPDAPDYADITSMANVGNCPVNILTYQDGEHIPH